MLGALAGGAFAAKDEITLISRQSVAAGGAVGDSLSASPSISSNGRYVAFESIADNLSDQDNDGVRNIFVRDVVTGVTTLVSRQSEAVGGAGGDGLSSNASISADGRRVAFESNADNLSNDDDDSVTNVFVRDLDAGTTVLVSRADGADGTGGDAESRAPAISATGRYVAFESAADNLSGVANGVQNIFLRDLETNTTTLLSVNSAGQAADGDNFSPSISDDGARIAFQSDGENMSDDDVGLGDVFVRDLDAGTTELVSRADGQDGVGGDDDSSAADISSSGRYVSFNSSASNLSDDDNDKTNVYLRDTKADKTELISRASGLGGAGADGEINAGGSVSADGRYVAFRSDAENLSGEDQAATVDVFLRDRKTATTSLLSRASGPAGVPGDDDSSAPSLSADGAWVAFQSRATNFSAADDNGAPDIYARGLLEPDAVVDGSASARKTQKQKRKKIVVKVRVKAKEDLEAKVTGKVKVKKKSYKLKPASKSLGDGDKKTLKLKPRKSKDAKRIARYLKRGKEAEAKLKVKLADGAGNKKTYKLSAELKR